MRICTNVPTKDNTNHISVLKVEYFKFLRNAAQCLLTFHFVI